MIAYAIKKNFDEDGMSAYRDVSIRSFKSDKAAYDEVLEYINSGTEMKAATIPGSEFLPLSDWVLYAGGGALWSEKAWKAMSPMLPRSAVFGKVKHEQYGTLYCAQLRVLTTEMLEDGRFVLAEPLEDGETLDLFRPHRALKGMHCSEAFKANWEKAGLASVSFVLAGELEILSATI